MHHFLFFSLSHPFFHLANLRFSLFYSPGPCPPYAKPRNSRKFNAGSVLASRTAKTREHFLCEVREASALRRGTQESLLITAISILSGGTPASIGRSLGGEGSRSAALLPAINGRILQLLQRWRQLQGPYK